ncbi:hypothetical protein [Paenibacillus xylaniclasticus]|uniref:hypothetical protein n=1 Tax=Paenibacillus xylaniclasticus TaxID=588083 RepID=UPI000FD818D8|nr:MULTISPECIES: hypothetical protein [Paenibacillus]GFN30936.1 hypothetical protein PCURB6_11960 [Paenibacillus curdlanolyticus]
MNEWPAAVWASVSAMTAALVLTLIFTLGNLAKESAAIQQADDTAIAIVKEHRKYDWLRDKRDIHAQEVMSVIGESAGMPQVKVYTKIGSYSVTLDWNKNTSKDYFKLSTLTTLLLPEEIFESKVTEDANGVVTLIEFWRLVNGQRG